MEKQQTSPNKPNDNQCKLKFDNVFTSASDEETDQGTNLCFQNKYQLQATGEIPSENLKGTNNHSNHYDGEDNATKHLTYVQNIRKPRIKASCFYFNNGSNLSDNTDDAMDDILTVVNKVYPGYKHGSYNTRKSFRDLITHTPKQNGEELIPLPTNDTSSLSIDSISSSSSYFDNGFSDPSSDDRDLSLTFNNTSKINEFAEKTNRSVGNPERALQEQKCHHEHVFYSDEEVDDRHFPKHLTCVNNVNNHTGIYRELVYFNNGSDSDERDERNFSKHLSCVNNINNHTGIHREYVYFNNGSDSDERDERNFSKHLSCVNNINNHTGIHREHVYFSNGSDSDERDERNLSKHLSCVNKVNNHIGIHREHVYYNNGSDSNEKVDDRHFSKHLTCVNNVNNYTGIHREHVYFKNGSDSDERDERNFSKHLSCVHNINKHTGIHSEHVCCNSGSYERDLPKRFTCSNNISINQIASISKGERSNHGTLDHYSKSTDNSRDRLVVDHNNSNSPVDEFERKSPTEMITETPDFFEGDASAKTLSEEEILSAKEISEDQRSPTTELSDDQMASAKIISEDQTEAQSKLSESQSNNQRIKEGEHQAQNQQIYQINPTALQSFPFVKVFGDTEMQIKEKTKCKTKGQDKVEGNTPGERNHDKFKSMTEFSLNGAFRHTCSGCGRKDCDGKFMKLLREMIKTGSRKGFEIRNVVPDGNCMFAAVIDQLELLDDCHTSPFALRQSCIEYLKSNPNSKDGTPFHLFLDGESWENYISRMSQEGQWGDHLMLQAISSVTNRKMTIINGDDDKNWVSIAPAVNNPSKPEPLYLGHVGELHYVSMRPVINEGEYHSTGEMMSLDLYSVLPSLPSVEDADQQQMFNEDYIDPWSDIPAVHLTFLIKQFIPLKFTIKSADSMCHQAFAIETSTEDFMDKKTKSAYKFQFKAIGDVVEGLFASSLDDRGHPESLLSGEWADVGIISSLTTSIAYPESMKGIASIARSDVIVETKYTHPGYVRLIAQYPESWELGESDWGAITYYIPNTHRMFGNYEETKEFKDEYAKQNPAVVYLFRKMFSAIFSPFWPEEASSWRYRQRNSDWPSLALIDSIVSEGVYYISQPHVKSSNPEIEFQTCFAVAERRLSNEGLSNEQRYCFIVLKALLSHTLTGIDLIDSTHLKSVFFYACEQVSKQFWTSRVSGCILFMIDTLIKHLERKLFPNYFIPENNMIDHLSDNQIQNILEKLHVLQSNPISCLYSIAYQNMLTNADEVFQEISFDIEDFHHHRSVRQSVIETLVPTKIKQAAKYIGTNNLDLAIEIIQEAHEDRLLVSTCEDNIPFTAFVTEVTNTFGLSTQWWLCLHADETLGTTLATELSVQNNPVSLKEIFGNDVAGTYGELLIPKTLSENIFSLCYDFYIYLTNKHRKKKAVAFLVKGRLFFLQLQEYGKLVEDFPCTVNTSDFNIINIYKIYKGLVQNFIITMSSEPLFDFELQEIASEVQAICEKVNTEESYAVLNLMWKFLENSEQCDELSRRLGFS